MGFASDQYQYDWKLRLRQDKDSIAKKIWSGIPVQFSYNVWLSPALQRKRCLNYLLLILPTRSHLETWCIHFRRTETWLMDVNKRRMKLSHRCNSNLSSCLLHYLGKLPIVSTILTPKPNLWPDKTVDVFPSHFAGPMHFSFALSTCRTRFWLSISRKSCVNLTVRLIMHLVASFLWFQRKRLKIIPLFRLAGRFPFKNRGESLALQLGRRNCATAVSPCQYAF